MTEFVINDDKLEGYIHNCKPVDYDDDEHVSKYKPMTCWDGLLLSYRANKISNKYYNKLMNTIIKSNNKSKILNDFEKYSLDESKKKHMLKSSCELALGFTKLLRERIYKNMSISKYRVKRLLPNFYDNIDDYMWFIDSL